ncbi:MAG: response regulator transcription factor, partial [Gaiellales bacterium]
MPVTVTIVEDFPIVRTAISDSLMSDSRLEVLDSCADAKSLLDSLIMREPDVALVDLHLPDMDGPKLIARIRRLHPSVRIVVFSACQRPAQVLAALHAGANGYMVKRQAPREVADALIAVSDGGTVLAPQVALAVLDPRAAAPGDGTGSAARLEPTDAEIVRMVVNGDTDEQIARTLFVSTRTVQNRLTRIRRMASVQRR